MGRVVAALSFPLPKRPIRLLRLLLVIIFIGTLVVVSYREDASHVAQSASLQNAQAFSRQDFIRQMRQDANVSMEEWLHRPHSSLVRILNKLSAPNDGHQSERSPKHSPGFSPEYNDIYDLPFQFQDWTDAEFRQKCDPMDKWVRRYTKLHQDMRSNRTQQRHVVISCPKNTNCGGLADRLIGASSAFIFGLLTNRSFLVRWDTALQPTDLFVSPYINWTYDPLLHHSNENTTINVLNRGPGKVESVFLYPSEDYNIRWPQKNVIFLSNRGIVSRLFKHKLYGPQLRSMGLEPNTGFSCITQFLFRPHPASLPFLAAYKHVLNHPRVFPVGVQIRTGDSSMRLPENDTSSITQFMNYFSCADIVTQAFAQPSQIPMYFLITDSYRIRYEALKAFPDKVLVTGLPISHLHKIGYSLHAAHLPSASRSLQKIKLISLAAMLENTILANIKYKVISQGGFGKLAAFMSELTWGINETTVLLRPHGNNDLKRLKVRNSECWRILDQQKRKQRTWVQNMWHKLFGEDEGSPWTSFEELASEWSLG